MAQQQLQENIEVILWNGKSIRKIPWCQMIQVCILLQLGSNLYDVAVASRILLKVKDRRGRKVEIKKAPAIKLWQGQAGQNYFLQAQPQPEDFFSSFFSMVPDSAHSGHFFGLHLPSLVAPHFSHLNTGILFSFFVN